VLPPKSIGSRGLQLEVRLLDVKPPVWRRILVSDSFTLLDLHRVLQITMGWTDSHLHRFVINKIEYGLASQWDDSDVSMLDESKIRLRALGLRSHSSFLYQYDMGDQWWHEVRVERVLPRWPQRRVVGCLAGESSCPPEDCGGPAGYAHLQEALGDPKHPQHDELREWVGPRFDARAFDCPRVNRALRRSLLQRIK
jgi:hypothetical protein